MITLNSETESALRIVEAQPKHNAVRQAVANLAAWLTTMRSDKGYSGPVVHWWQSCLQFTGAAFDWRYEGIISGYLDLHRASGEDKWLRRARQAGNDLVAGQLPTGNFRNSAFELNPATGGTPHEAACALALLRLSRQLTEAGVPGADAYFDAARANLSEYHIARLWQGQPHTFAEPGSPAAFVPNKAATIAEALFLLADLEGDHRWQDYAMAALDRLLDHQRSTQPAGAIYQYSEPAYPHGQRKYFPLYNARCVPALLEAGRRSGDPRFAAAAHAALQFLLGSQRADGSFPQVVYAHGIPADYPSWVAGLADILRVLTLAAREWPAWTELVAAEQRGLGYLLGGQLPSGGFRSAYGFAAQCSQRRRDIRGDDLRDLLPVCGWNDKVLAYLGGLLVGETGGRLPDPKVTDWVLPCAYAGAQLILTETSDRIYARRSNGTLVYDWRKGDEWAAVCDPMFYRR